MTMGDIYGPYWISVKERLPEDGVPVVGFGHDEHGEKIMGLTTCQKSIFDQSIYWDDLAWPNYKGWGMDETITHWQPLPEPPEKIPE